MTEEDVRAALFATILEGIARRNRPITEIASLTQLPDIILEEIASGRRGQVIDRVAMWPLLRAVAALGHDVTITVGRAQRTKGKVAVKRLED